MTDQTPTAAELVAICDQVRAAAEAFENLPAPTARLVSIVLFDAALLKARFSEELSVLVAGMDAPTRKICIEAQNIRAQRLMPPAKQ